MDFEWDWPKSDRNRRERGFGFGYAAQIFTGATLEAADDRRDYGEARIRAIGAVGQNLLTVIYTDRGEVRRIISARPANREERRRWQERG